jgi:hypothetical protein
MLKRKFGGEERKRKQLNLWPKQRKRKNRRTKKGRRRRMTVMVLKINMLKSVLTNS